MKIVNDDNASVNLDELADGDIAIITAWEDTRYIGTIVQRYAGVLIALGQSSGKSWPSILGANKYTQHKSYQVRILKPGTLIEL